jgi:hypothetical protein
VRRIVDGDPNDQHASEGPGKSALGCVAISRPIGHYACVEVTRLHSSRWRVIGIVVFSVAAFLLLSMGGGIIAAPVTVPLMFVAAHRHPTRPFRIIGAALIGATIAEVVWALTYLAVGEAKPWIWLLPLAAAITAMAALWSRTGTPRRRMAAHA